MEYFSSKPSFEKFVLRTTFSRSVRQLPVLFYTVYLSDTLIACGGGGGGCGTIVPVESVCKVQLSEPTSSLCVSPHHAVSTPDSTLGCCRPEFP